jgi:DNA integrity scanning protein DisA with diadenylate cyclase activity
MIPVEPTAEHPIPFDLSDAQPVTHKDAVATASNTIDLISELGGSIDFSNDDLHKAANLITGTEKPNTPKHISSSAEAAAAHVLIREFDFTAFADALQARNFITNKLIRIADCGDPKTELKALELLGKHSDIGLFTERSEITINHTTSDALEKSIKDRVKRLLNTDATDVKPRLIDELDDVIEAKKAEKDAEKAKKEGENGE